MSEIANRLFNEIICDNQHAFKKLYLLYYSRLCSFAFLFLRSKELSEEAVSDVFMNVWLKRATLHRVKNIQTYLYTAVHNQSIDYLRANARYDKEMVNVFEVEITSSDSVEDDITQYEQHELLQHAVDELPEKCRVILRMYLNDELTYKEIAGILNISRKTVETHIAIAIRKLREKMV